MTKALADMVLDLQEDVPAVDGVPSDAQYERAIKDAVAEFSRLCGREKNTTLSIVSGTANYALPDDFLKKIELDSPFDPEHGVIITATGIIPFGASGIEEEITIRNRTLTIYPTPTYTVQRFMEYKAAWILNEANEYDLTDDEVEIVMIKAKALCFEKINNASASTGFRYSVGNMSVDKSGMGEGYSKRVSELEDKFERACARYNGTVALC